MKLENLVCSFDLAKKLKEIGFHQDSYFFAMRCEIPECDCGNKITYFSYTPDHPKSYAIFTAGELLEYLPTLNDPYRLSFGIECHELWEECGGKYYCLTDVVDYPHEQSFYSNNLADCLAQMIIYLIENKHFKTATIMEFKNAFNKL